MFIVFFGTLQVTMISGVVLKSAFFPTPSIVVAILLDAHQLFYTVAITCMLVINTEK